MRGHHGSIGAGADGDNKTYVRNALEAGIKKRKKKKTTQFMALDSTFQLLHKL